MTKQQQNFAWQQGKTLWHESSKLKLINIAVPKLAFPCLRLSSLMPYTHPKIKMHVCQQGAGNMSFLPLRLLETLLAGYLLIFPILQGIHCWLLTGFIGSTSALISHRRKCNSSWKTRPVLFFVFFSAGRSLFNIYTQEGVDVPEFFMHLLFSCFFLLDAAFFSIRCVR